MGPLLLIALEFAAGGVASISDFREGKIYNKHLALFGLLGLGIYAIFYGELFVGYGLTPIINALISLVVSFLLYYTRFWSAGDAKLFCVMAMLMPFSLYPQGPLFPAFYLMLAIFSLGFFYLLAESVYYWVVDRRRPTTDRQFVRPAPITRSFILYWFLRYLAASLALGALYRIAGMLMPAIMSRDQGLVLVSGTVLLVLFYVRLSKPRVVLGVIAVCLVINIALVLAAQAAMTMLLDLRGPLVALLTIGVMQFVAKYDYMRIPVTRLRAGMVLSALTVATFRGSRVRGLPQITRETADSKLTPEQVSSIKRWSTSQSGGKNLIVVTHMPFAPFILAGCVVYVILATISLAR